MNAKPFPVAIAMVLALAGCGGDDVPSAVPVTTNAAANTEPVATDSPTATPFIVAYSDNTEVLSVLEAMPAVAGGAVRVEGSAGEARYRLGEIEFGIEAAEIEDAFGRGATLDDALALLAEDIVDERECGEGETWCLSGNSGDGLVVVVWGHRQGGLMLAAVAPSQDLIDELLNAWREAAS